MNINVRFNSAVFAHLKYSNIRVLGVGSEDRCSNTLRPAGGVLVAGGAGGPAAEGHPEEECSSRMAL